MANRRPVDLDEFLERQLYPALFAVLDTAFPEYGFTRDRSRKSWVASGDATRGLPGGPRADRVYCYENRPHGLVIQGGEFVRFLDLVNGGRKPTGAEFIEAVRTLAKKAHVSMPEREVTPEQAAKAAERHARHSALERVISMCHAWLFEPVGEQARAYLTGRGYTEEAMHELRLGFYPSVKEVEDGLRASKASIEDAKKAALLWSALEGRVLFPWSDAAGQPLTIYADYPKRPVPKGVTKLEALPGEGTKSSPFHFDRARRAGHRDVVLVEGITDASLLQAMGDARVIACAGGQLTGDQLDTLARYNVQSVTLCLDPDSAGERGTLACIRQLMSKGIRAYVAPTLPDGLDPDEFVLKHGLDGWRAHIAKAEHSLRYVAQTILKKHKGDAWTDMTRDACLDEAIAFEASIEDPQLYSAVADVFLPEIADGAGVDLDALAIRAEDARAKAVKAKEARSYSDLLRQADDKLQGGDVDAAKRLLREGTEKLWKEERTLTSEPVLSVAEELAEHREHLAKLQGRQYLGLPQKVLPTLDQRTLGLRGLILLAAAPNVGKTTLALQLGLDVVLYNPDAAFLLLSLEMSRKDMLTRLKSRLSGVAYEALMRGCHFDRDGKPYALREEETAGIARAEETLAKIGQRIRILDDKNFPMPTLEKLLDQVEALRAVSGAKKVFIAVDYLQVWPIPDSQAKNHKTDLDADKWRIGQLKELRDALGNEGAVLVISEANKASFDGNDSLTAVMGTARGTYTPDMVFLLRQMPDEELIERHGDRLESSVETGKGGNKRDEEKLTASKAREIREKLFAEGFDEQRLVIVKGRDGVRRGTIELRHYFTSSTFEERRDD